MSEFGRDKKERKSSEILLKGQRRTIEWEREILEEEKGHKSQVSNWIKSGLVVPFRGSPF